MGETQSEVIIIGAGLAGLTAAIDLLQKGFQVRLFEQKELPRHKVCGEYLSAEVRQYLERLHALPAEEDLPKLEQLLITSEKGRTLESALEQGGIGISRYRLDHHLLQQALKHGLFYHPQEKVKDWSFAADRFTVHTAKGEQFQAPVLLAAFGKHSALNAGQAEQVKYLGVKMHYRGEIPLDQVQLHNFKGGYAGLSKVEEGKVNLCYLIEQKILDNYPDLNTLHQQHLARNPFLADFLRQAEPLFDQLLVISKIDFSPREQIQDHALMIGDAAGMIHPFCGNGMAMAVHGAQLAVREAINFLDLAQNRAEMEQNYRDAWAETFKQRLQFGRAMQPLFGKKALTEFTMSFLSLSPALLQKITQYAHGDEMV